MTDEVKSPPYNFAARPDPTITEHQRDTSPPVYKEPEPSQQKHQPSGQVYQNTGYRAPGYRATNGSVGDGIGVGVGGYNPVRHSRPMTHRESAMPYGQADPTHQHQHRTPQSAGRPAYPTHQLHQQQPQQHRAPMYSRVVRNPAVDDPVQTPDFRRAPEVSPMARGGGPAVNRTTTTQGTRPSPYGTADPQRQNTGQYTRPQAPYANYQQKQTRPTANYAGQPTHGCE